MNVDGLIRVRIEEMRMDSFNGAKTKSTEANGHPLTRAPGSTKYLVSCRDCGHIYGEYDDSGDIPDCPSLLTERAHALGDMTGDRG